MNSTPAAKRRRLNDASKTLHKPFKSPFRTPLKAPLSSDPPSSDPPDLNTSQPTAVSTPLTTPSLCKQAIAKPLLVPRENVSTSTPTRVLQNKTKTKASASKPSLTREIIQLRNEIQILSQAHALATSTKDEDLTLLVDRWRTASRAAAEELFASTRDRVNRMGGVGAWKDREKEQKEWQRQREIEEIQADKERLQEAREEAREGMEGDYEEYADVGGEDRVDAEEQEEEKFKGAADDDSFTMDMMLKTLNINLKLIGYNKEAQRWDG